MAFFDRHSAVRRAIAVVLAAVVPSACVTWQPIPPGRLPPDLPAHVRVTLVDLSAIDLYSPAVAANALNGLRRKGVESSRVSIPMRNVRGVETRRADDEATMKLISAVFVVASVVGVVAIIASTTCVMCGGGSGLPRL